jgi:hypothetical protein
VFLSGQTVSLFGDGLAVLAVPLLVLGLTRSPLISALSAASATLGYLAVGLPAGVLVDRLDAWRVLVVTDVARAAAFAVLYLLWVTGAATLWVIMTIALAAGAASVFSETALVVVVKDLFPGPALIRANSALELASQGALVAGPALVGVLAAAGELGAALLADAATFAVSLLSLLAVRGRVPRSCRRGGRGWRALTADFRAGIGYLLSVRVLVIMTVVQIVVNLCLATEKLMFFYARDTLGLGAAGVGAVIAAGGAGGVAGALSASWLAARIGQIRMVVLAVAASGLALASVSITGSLVTLGAVNLVYLWAITAASLANRTYRQLIVPRELLGRVTSTVRLLFLAADPVGVVIAGSLAAAIGPRPVFLGAGILVAVTAAAGWRAGLRRAGPAGPPRGPWCPW